VTAPYLVGDHVQALSAGPAGTSLITGRVVGIQGHDDPTYAWTITYTDPHHADGTRSVSVDQYGRDRHRYVERTYGVLPWPVAQSDAARLLHDVVVGARADGITGGLLRAAGDDGVSAAWAWPSGADRYVVDMDCTVTPPNYEVSAFRDGEPEAHHLATLPTPSEVVDELAWLHRSEVAAVAAGQAAAYTITCDHAGGQVIDSGTATDADARRLFETVAARLDQEMRREANTAHVRIAYGDRVAHARQIGASDPWAASGFRYWGRALEANGITNDVDVEDTGGGIYVPFVKIGTAWRIDIVDDEDGTFLAVFATNEQAQAREGAEIRHAYGLTGADVIDFVRDAIHHDDDEVYPDSDPFTAAIANATTCLYCLTPHTEDDARHPDEFIHADERPAEPASRGANR
jgi:hypothetical protein